MFEISDSEAFDFDIIIFLFHSILFDIYFVQLSNQAQNCVHIKPLDFGCSLALDLIGSRDGNQVSG